MLLRIRHETIYRYGAPVKSVTQKLLLTPRNNAAQRVVNWRIEVDRDCRLRQSEDAFGNIQHSFTVEGPFDALTTLVEGEVETFDHAGVIGGVVERFPPALYLRETELTAADAALRDFADEAGRREASALDRLHALMAALHAAVAFEEGVTPTAAPAALAFAQKRGGCQDFAHIFVACARALEIPARYVSGYFKPEDGEDAQAAGHAWAEAHVEKLGWVGFDATQCISPNDAYVRVAAALDHLGAAPIRSARVGGAGEEMEVRLLVAMARQQSQC